MNAQIEVSVAVVFGDLRYTGFESREQAVAFDAWMENAIQEEQEIGGVELVN